MGKNGVTGIIVPLEAETIDRVLHHRPVVPLFVDEYPSDLELGDRAFFLEVGGGKVLQAEGSVSSIARETVSQVRLYGNDLCLSSQELTNHVRSRSKSEGDQMLVLKIDQPTKYIRAIKCTIAVPRGGLYMTAERYFTILHENQ